MDIHRRLEWLKRYNTELSSDVDLITKIEAYEHEALVDAYGDEAVEEIINKIQAKAKGTVEVTILE
jgi:hypothetical protein